MKSNYYKSFKTVGILAAGLGVIIDAIVTMVDYFVDQKNETHKLNNERGN